MCGIAGSINTVLSKQSLDLIHHRGPDSQGYTEIQVGPHKVYLGQTRLSILDLSEAGSQPMYSECGNYCIVFNGEIYNHLDLRKELSGINFRGHSDTETILYYLIKFGVKAAEKFNGIFAFGFIDIKNETFYLVRDQFGIKPLYYHYKDDKLLFGSELKVIAANEFYKKSIDEDALSAFLSLRYNPSPYTLFKDIYRLEAAHYIQIKLGQPMKKDRYWHRIPVIDTKISEAEAIEKYQFLLEQGVKRQLLSDVPVGLFLSGGVDSAIIGYLMQQHTNYQIKTFTVGFEGEGDFNETADARESAQFIGSEHHEEIITTDVYHSYFLKSFFHTEEPIAEPTIPALSHVSKMAAREVKVVLSGQGADEPLAGYKRYYGEQLLAKYHSLFRLAPQKLVASLFPLNETLQRGIYASRFSNEFERIMAIYTIFSPAMKKGLLKTDTDLLKKDLTESLFRKFYDDVKGWDNSLSKILYMDVRTMLPDNLLLFNDKTTMAHSIENRVPFLDIDLVNFVETLPANMKLNGKTRKYIHKKALTKWLPEHIIHRKKRGFATPIDEWFRGSLGNDLLDLVNSADSGASAFFNKEYISKMVSDHQNKKANYKRHLFALLSFELWYRKFYKKF